MGHISKRGLVALIVGITVMASLLPFIFEGGGTENTVAASISTDSVATQSYDPASPMISDPRAVFEMAADSGVPSEYIYLPNIFAQKLADGGVNPLYTASPAPMGVTDYGYMEPSGLKIPYQYNTTSFLGTAMFESLKAQYLMNNNPGTVAVQLSAVLSFPGSHGNSFYWIKNIMLYTPSTGEAQVISNIWDLSSPSFSFPNGGIMSGNGNMIPGLMYYYVGPEFTLSGENTVALYVNTGIIGGSNAVIFQYSTGTGEHGTAAPGITYDTVIFSAAGAGGSGSQGKFIVDGFSKTPSGLLKDVELAVTGPGMGSTTSIYDANGQLTLKFLGADGTYTKLPAAYNYGSNTGETVQGLSVWWSSQMKPMAHLTTGPSLPVSMWGSQVSHSGAVNLQGKIDPANAFVFISMGTKINNDTAAWAAVNQNGTYKFSLPGRITYTMEVLSSNHDPQTITIATSTNESSEEGTGQSHGGGGGGEGEDETLAWNNFTLNENQSLGVYTPLYADGNDQLKYLTTGQSGTGSASDPYVLENNQYTRISGLFTRANNFLYPQFSGLLLENTNAFVKVDNPPNFQYKYPVGYYNQLSSMQLPYYNNLNMVFYNTSSVIVTNGSSITGWVPDTMAVANEANLMFIDSTDFLVASNSFNSMGSSLSVYSSNNIADNGTVWGNSFGPDLVLGSSYSSSMHYHEAPLALSVYSSGNLIYGNYFREGINVISPLHDPYTKSPTIYNNAWNLPQKEGPSFVNWANGQELKGNIVNCSFQGGNYWESQNISQVPMNGHGGIASGGDYLPLSMPSYPVTFNAIGAVPDTGWAIQIFSKVPIAIHGQYGKQFMFNGTYEYRIISGSSYSATPSTGTFTVNGSSQDIAITFSKVAYPVTFTSTGIPVGTTWSISVGQMHEATQNSTITLYLGNGSYGYSAGVDTPQQYASASGNILVAGVPVNQEVRLNNQLHEVNFALGQGNFMGNWALNLNGITYRSSAMNITSALQNGVYQYSASAPEGYVITPSSGTVMVYNGNVSISLNISKETYRVTFVGDGLKSGTPWEVQFAGQSVNSTDSEISFEVPVGNYTYNIPGVGDYSNTQSSGYLLVSDSNLTVDLEFKPPVDYMGGAMNALIGTVTFAAITALATYFVGKRK